MILCFMTSCGESSKDRQAREATEAQRVADSIAKVEADRAKLEQHRLDSIASAEKRAARMAADSTVRAELLPNFTEETIPEGSLYKVKGTPRGHRQNCAYLTFVVDNGVARDIFLNVDYFGENWLNIEKTSLLIDGETTDLSIQGDVSNNVNSDATCSEWFTSMLSSNTMDKILEAKKIIIKLAGDERDKNITLNSKQIADMQKTIKLYRAFGG